jgi:hypothetical protein
MFLSSIVLAGGSVAAFGKSFQLEPPTGGPGAGDALFEHLQLQMAALLRNARSRGGLLSAEDAATAAAFMRVAGVHARGLQLDEQAKRTLAGRMAAVGRDGLVNLPPDLTLLRARMRRKGFAISDRLVDQASSTDVATRQAALDSVQRGHVTQVCDRLAEAFEAAAPRLAAHKDVRRIATAPDESWCSFLVGQWAMYLAVACYIAAFNDPSMQPFLESMWSGFVVYEALYLQQC